MVDEGAGSRPGFGAVAGPVFGAERLRDLLGDQEVVDRLFLHATAVLITVWGALSGF